MNPPRRDTAWSTDEDAAAIILRERARALARPVADAAKEEETLAIAIFRLGEERYAIEARFVLEVTRPDETTPVPGLPEFFLGVTNRRGEILAVVDLARFLGIDRGAESDRSRLIVLGDAAPEFGIIADEVEEICRIAERALHPPSTGLGGARRAYVRAVTSDALVVLDGAALLADERFFVDQGEERPAPAKAGHD